MRIKGQEITALAMCLLGLLGLYFKVEYSGWVLFVGVMTYAFS